MADLSFKLADDLRPWYTKKVNLHRNTKQGLGACKSVAPEVPNSSAERPDEMAEALRSQNHEQYSNRSPGQRATFLAA